MKRMFALVFATLGVASAVIAPANAAAKPDIKQIVDDLIVCVTEPCP
jgi:hypothetical protein